MTEEPIEAAEVAERLERAGLPRLGAHAEPLASYLNLLMQWNRVYNLTGIRERGEVLDRHLVESLALGPWLAGRRIADVGTGAGLPGLPLAICHRDRDYTLVESRRKRVSFLRHVVAALELAHVRVAHGRAEDLPTGEPFATVLARAVAPPAGLLDLVRLLTAPGGRLVLLTSAAHGREIVDLGRRAGDFAARDTAAGPAALKSTIVVLERVAESKARA